MDYASKKERNRKFHVHLTRRLLVSKGNLFAQIFRPSSKAYRYLGFNTVGSLLDLYSIDYYVYYIVNNTTFNLHKHCHGRYNTLPRVSNLC